ncbi:hypothetical protein FS837_007037 [Tulasnella sp. UAMH 9824]|nr:hypothetical protein FS837_007037 [Tulasnella sp. UAMH 9824]
MSSEPSRLPPGGSIVLHVLVEGKSVEAANQLVKLLQAIKESAKISEPGTLDFRIYQFEWKLLLLEEYEDETALQTHFKNETVKAFLEAIPSLATGAPTLSYYKEAL